MCYGPSGKDYLTVVAVLAVIAIAIGWLLKSCIGA